MAKHYRSGFTPGAQTQINAIYETVGSGIAERLVEQSYQAAKVFLVTQLSITGKFSFAVITADEIDIGGKVKFAPAQFTHGDNIEFHCIAVTFQRLPMLG